MFVHRFKRLLGVPFEPRGADLAATRSADAFAIFGQIEWRHDVVVHIDQWQLHRLRLLSKRRAAGGDRASRAKRGASPGSESIRGDAGKDVA